MRISVFGVGYVGCVSAACLAELGHHVLAVETNATKLELINAGQSPIIEARLDQLIASSVTSGRLCASADATLAVKETELAIVCVGTPSQANGSIDLNAVVRVCEQIGTALAANRST